MSSIFDPNKKKIEKRVKSEAQRPDEETLESETLSEEEIEELADIAVENDPSIRPAGKQIAIEHSMTASRYNREVEGVRSWTLGDLHKWCRQWIDGHRSEWTLKKDGWGLVPGVVQRAEDKRRTVGGEANESYGEKGLWRQKHAMEGADILVYDIEDFDFGTDDPEELEDWLRERIPDTDMLLWSSWHHGLRYPVGRDGIKSRSHRKWRPGEPRFRLVIPLSERVDPEEYSILWEHIGEKVLEEAPDMGTSDITRIAYVPKPQPDCAREEDPDPFVHRVDCGGEVLDVQDLPSGESLESLVEAEKRRRERRKEKREERLADLEEAGVEIPDADSEAARRHAERTLEDRCQQIRTVPENQSRHDSICSISGGHIGELVNDGVLSVEEVVDSFTEAVPRVGERQDRDAWHEEIRDLVESGADLAADDGRSYDFSQAIDKADVDDDQGRPVFHTPTDRTYAQVFMDRYPTGEDLHRTSGRWFDWDPDQMVYQPIEPGEEEKRHFSLFLKRWDGAKKIDQYGNVKQVNANRRFVEEKVLEHVPDELPDSQVGEGALDGPPCVSAGDAVYAIIDDTAKKVSDPESAKLLKPTVSVDYNYDSDASPTNFLQILENVWGNDEDHESKKQFLQEWVGSCLLGIATDYNVSTIFLGSGSNGKSTVLRLIEEMWPEDALGSLPVQQWSKRFQLPQLLNVTLNSVEEMPGRELVDGSAFKRVVDGSPNVIERKHKPPYRARIEAGHLFAANNLPSVSDMSRGFWRRWRILTFNEDFDRADQQAFDLDQEVDLGALFSWFLKGGMRLAQRGRSQGDLPEIPSSRGAKSEWRQDVDPVSKYVAEKLEKLPDSANTAEGTPRKWLFEDFKENFCSAINRGSSIGQSTFYERLERAMDVEMKRGTSPEGTSHRYYKVVWKDDQTKEDIDEALDDVDGEDISL